MSDTVNYIVIDGERWDTIAHKAYGKASLYRKIIEANPNVPITPRLAAGTVLIVPILPETDVKTNKESLPPWKQ